jgi:hypothetical protein
VNAHISKFKKLGFIEKNGGVLHVNPARLHHVHDGERHISLTAAAASAACAAIPQVPKAEERHWPQAG